MAEWRLGRGWNEDELVERLRQVHRLRRNFEGSHQERSERPEWDTHGSRSRIARGAPGAPEDPGPFERGRVVLERYAFSDPSIVEAHFDPDAPLDGRHMLLELKVLGLRYLCGVVVGAVRDERTATRSVFGYRYDTLEGHIEAGSEWFLLEKDHEDGEVTFRIDATWRIGEFPNWWSRIGFALLGPRSQRKWHVRAHRRMAALATGAEPSALRPGRGRLLAHEGPEVVFTGDMER